MNAEFFEQAPPQTATASQASTSESPRARQFHRVIAILFTLTVVANFAAMPWGLPPAWITYSPLPPLFLLMGTGLTMLVSSWIRQARARRAAPEGATR